MSATATDATATAYEAVSEFGHRRRQLDVIILLARPGNGDETAYAEQDCRAVQFPQIGELATQHSQARRVPGKQD
jgi:hypothetical protein